MTLNVALVFAALCLLAAVPASATHAYQCIGEEDGVPSKGGLLVPYDPKVGAPEWTGTKLRTFRVPVKGVEAIREACAMACDDADACKGFVARRDRTCILYKKTGRYTSKKWRNTYTTCKFVPGV